MDHEREGSSDEPPALDEPPVLFEASSLFATGPAQPEPAVVDDEPIAETRSTGWLLPTVALAVVLAAVALGLIALLGTSRNDDRADTAPPATTRRPSTTARPTTTARPATTATSTTATSTTGATTTSTRATTTTTTAAPTTVPTTAPPTTVPAGTAYTAPDGAFTATVAGTPTRTQRKVNNGTAVVTQSIYTVPLADDVSATVQVAAYPLTPSTTDAVLARYVAGDREWPGGATTVGQPYDVAGGRALDGTITTATGRYRSRTYAVAGRLHHVGVFLADGTPAGVEAAFEALIASYRPAT